MVPQVRRTFSECFVLSLAWGRLAFGYSSIPSVYVFTEVLLPVRTGVPEMNQNMPFLRQPTCLQFPVTCV